MPILGQDKLEMPKFKMMNLLTPSHTRAPSEAAATSAWGEPVLSGQTKITMTSSNPEPEKSTNTAYGWKPADPLLISADQKSQAAPTQELLRAGFNTDS